MTTERVPSETIVPTTVKNHFPVFLRTIIFYKNLAGIFCFVFRKKEKRFRFISDSLRSTCVSTTICCSAALVLFLWPKERGGGGGGERLPLPVEKFGSSCVIFVFLRYFSRLQAIKIRPIEKHRGKKKIRWRVNENKR